MGSGMPHCIPLVVTALAAFTPVALVAETTSVEAHPKVYSGLFAPVAIEDRRALSIDRSNFTYSPSGLDSGALQIEVSIVEYTQDDRIPGVSGKLKQFAFGTAAVRIGVADDLELQAITTAHVTARLTDPAGAVTRFDGLGDTLVQARYTMAGNHGEPVGLAVLPYVKLPTNTLDGLFNDKLEGGMQVPVSRAIGDRFTALVAFGFDLNYNAQPHDDYDFNPFVSGALWCVAVPDRLFLFNEVYLRKNTGAGRDDLVSYYGLGGVYQLSTDCGIDFGVNLGLTDASADIFARTGVSFRF